MELKKKEKLNFHNNLVKLSEILDDSKLLDMEVLRETQGINI